MADEKTLRSTWTQACQLLDSVKVSANTEGRSFDTQKIKLWSWGKSVGLLGAEARHPGLDDLKTRLETIKHFEGLIRPLSDERLLAETYGLTHRDPEKKSSGLRKVFGIKSKKETTLSSSAEGRKVWFVGNERKFAALIELLRQSSYDLASLYPPVLQGREGMRERPSEATEALERFSVGTITANITGPTDFSAIVLAAVGWRGDNGNNIAHARSEEVRLTTQSPTEGNNALYHQRPLFGNVEVDGKYWPPNDHYVLLDPESQSRYFSANPGVVTVPGYGAECWDWEEAFGKARYEPSGFSVDTDHITASELLEWYEWLRKGEIPSNIDEKQFALALFRLTKFVATDPLTKIYGCQRLLRVEDALWNSKTQPIVASLCDGPDRPGTPLRDFVLRMIWAAIFLDSMPRVEPLVLTNGSNWRSEASAYLARQWISNIRLTSTDETSEAEQVSDKDGHVLRMHLPVLEEQLQGLIQFARDIRWPLLDETMDYTANITNQCLTLAPELQDWLAGLTLPGSYMSIRLMKALVQSSPSLQTLSGSPAVDGGLLLSTQSYWRVRSALGRVLAALPNVGMICGWVGPCAIQIADAMEDKPAFLKLLTRRVQPLPNKYGRKEASDPRYRDPFEGVQVVFGEDTRQFTHLVQDETEYAAPDEPKDGLAVKFVDVVLRRAETQADEFYRAETTFEIAGAVSHYELRFNPVFISLPACYSGPHKLHKRERQYYGAAISVDQLTGIAESETKVVSINATGAGAEAMARAWCAANGRHAIIRRTGDACYACCLRNAGDGELGTKTVIWVN